MYANIPALHALHHHLNNSEKGIDTRGIKLRKSIYLLARLH